jgi:hypothetical protein
VAVAQPLGERQSAPLNLVPMGHAAVPRPGVAKPNKAALADLTASILSSLRNHKGNGIQRTNEGSPARWRLAPN